MEPHRTAAATEVARPRVRQPAFDALKLFAIFLVLWGHAIHYGQSDHTGTNLVYRTIYSFHMPLFMMVSGYFAASSLRAPVGKFLWRKFRQLLLPWISWNLALSLLLVTVAIIKTGDTNLLRLVQGHSLYLGLWFLKSCFVCFLMAYPLYHWGGGRWWLIVAVLFLSQCVPSFNLPLMWPSFIVGLELSRQEKWRSFLRKHYMWLGLAYVILMCFWSPKGLQPWSVWQGRGTDPQTFCTDFLYQIYRLCVGISGSLCCIGLFQHIFSQKKEGRIVQTVCAWGQLTLGIYILQTLFIERIMPRLVSFDSLSLPLFSFVVSPLLSLVVLVLCVGLIRLISRSKICAFLFFGKPMRTV